MTARPSRLHHHAYVSADQERTRAFYEDVVGLPLVATWCEDTDGTLLCHTFFELEDGSALAFFQFADPVVQEANTTRPTTVYDHVALAAEEAVQAAIAERAAAHGVGTLLIDHGYCRSLYLTDPDGLLLEITVDEPSVASSAPARRAAAHAELARWLAGDHSDNNPFRAH